MQILVVKEQVSDTKAVQIMTDPANDMQCISDGFFMDRCIGLRLENKFNELIINKCIEK